MSYSYTGKKILILGCGTWQVPWLRRAREMGLKVYATDWESRPEGLSYVDVFRQIDLKDKEGSLAFALEHQVEAIFTSADIGVQTAAYVAARMNLPYHSEELAFRATNKHAMRQRALEIGLGIPTFRLTNTLADAVDALAEMGYPAILKPVDSASSRGVFVVDNPEELYASYEISKAASFSGFVLVEEFMRGTESSVEALVSGGKPIILGVCDKIKSPLPYRYDIQLNYPADFSPAQYQLIHEFIDKLVQGFNIGNGIIHVELMVGKDDVKLIEFAIRGCGSKVITHLMPATTGVDVMTWALHAALGNIEPVTVNRKNPGILKFIMLPEGKVKEITGLDEARAINGILACDVEKKPGDIIAEIRDGRSRPGYILASAASTGELDVIVKKAMTTIQIEMDLND